MGWNPFKKSSWKKLGSDIAKGAKAVGDGIKKVGDGIANGVGKAVEWTADKLGDVAQGAGKALTTVTGIKAFEKAGNKINNFTDDQMGPALSRALTAPIKAVTGMPQAMMEKGIIDGITQQGAELVQDYGGAAARLVAGKNAESKFDKWYDEKAQIWVEAAASSVMRAGLAVVPGGQAVLAVDAASEVASLGYRAGNGEDLKWYDMIDAGMAIAPGALGAVKGAAGAVKGAVKAGASAGTKSAVKQGVKASATSLKASAKNGIASAKQSLRNGASDLKSFAKGSNTWGDTLKSRKFLQAAGTHFAIEGTMIAAAPTIMKHLMPAPEVPAAGEMGSVAPTNYYSTDGSYVSTPSTPTHLADVPTGYAPRVSYYR